MYGDYIRKKEKDFIRIVYQTKPIGKEKIVLYLTTIDLDKFKEKGLKDIPYKEEAREIYISKEVDPVAAISVISAELNETVNRFYKFEIERLKEELKYMCKREKQQAKNYGSIKNCNHIVANTIEGNVINCNDLQVEKINREIINCNFKGFKNDIF